jgi:hypothetical protein
VNQELQKRYKLLQFHLLPTLSFFFLFSISRKMSQSKCQPRAERVSTDHLLAIKPEHLANIVSREKNHEYRKYRLEDGVSRLWLYETGSDGGSDSITYVSVYISQ